MHSKNLSSISTHQMLLSTVTILSIVISFLCVNAQRAPSYFERWQMARNLLSRQQNPAENKISEEHQKLYKKFVDLSPADIQKAVLDSVRRFQQRELSYSMEQPLLTREENGTTESPVVTKIPPWIKYVNVSELCLNHTAATVIALVNREWWALQMLDAMGKPSPALMQGNLMWPGSYDECINVRAQTDVISHPAFKGQYCNLLINLDVKIPGLAPSAPGQSVADGLVLNTGICIPDTCSNQDMSFIMIDVLLRLNIVKMADVNFCVHEERSLDAKAVAAVVICSILLALMILGTVVDVLFIQMPKSTIQNIPKFSANSHADFVKSTDLEGGHIANGHGRVNEESLPLISSNGVKLLSTRQAPGSLTCIHGVRFLSMTWVVLGHTFMTPMSFGANVLQYEMEANKRWTFQAITNALVSVDSFFVLSGLLVTYLSLKEMKKTRGKINWFLFYFHRFWRLTPAYMLVIMVYVCFLPYWGRGPIWVDSIPDRENCEKYWWTNLLYLNNLIHVDKMCLGQSWYLANDMQFYVLSPIIFVPLFFSPLIGLAIAAVFFTATTITPAVLAFKNHYPTGLFSQTEGQSMDPNAQAEWAYDFYMKPYTRMGAYIVGMLAGYFLYYTDCKLRISKVLNLLIWAIATAVALAVLYGLYHTANGHPMPVSLAAFYNGVHRQTWSICVSWVVIACVTGNGGFIDKLLSWSAFVPLSRLTYCISDDS